MENTIPKNETKEYSDNNKNQVAIKMAFVGTGQGGGRIADAFYRIGNPNVMVVNTTEQDFLGLKVPDANRLCMNTCGVIGAGKNMSVGEKVTNEHSSDIIHKMTNLFEKDIEQIMVCIGAGGGTGGGSIKPLLKACENYFKRNLKDENLRRKVGVILSLPKLSEGGFVQKNALEVISFLLEELRNKKISPLIVIDNAVIADKLGPATPIKKFWFEVNNEIVTGFNIFNVLASKKSEYSTFDKSDLTTILDSGLITYGLTALSDYSSSDSIAKAIRNNLFDNLLCRGMNFKQATHAGAIMVASENVLMEVPQSYMESALFTLAEMMESDKNKAIIHSGIYEAKNEGLFLYTMVGGMPFPSERLLDMEERATK